MKNHFYLLCIAIFAILLGGCSKNEDCDPNDEESPCYAGIGGGGGDKDGLSECSYKITINGEATLPNQFGKDRLVFQTSAGKVEQDGVVLMLSQAKIDPKEVSIFTFMSHGFIDRRTSAQTTYHIATFQSTRLSTSTLSALPLYGYADDQKDYGSLTLTLLENSDQRIRIKASGTAMKLDDDEGGGIQEKGLVPVEAEITIGRKYYNESRVNGVFVGGAVCDCQ